MHAAPSALIIGLTGQDGSFLAELLLEKGYRVSGVVRGAPERPLGCAEHLRDHVEVLPGDLTAPGTLRAAIEQVRPQEVYHLAAPSFVPESWQRPAETLAAITGSAAAVLEAVRDLDEGTRALIFSSGAMFGDAGESPQREETPCRPGSPYAVAKLAAHQLVGAMRTRECVHASSAIAFNHESERRPEQFVTRKISRGAAAIALGLQQQLTLGSLEAVRDWSFAGDIVHGAWLMLQQDRGDDYVLASGEAHTVAQFAQAAFACVELEAERYVRVDPALVRPPEPTPSVGDPAKARARLGWRARLGFAELVERMVRADLRTLGAAAARR